MVVVLFKVIQRRWLKILGCLVIIVFCVIVVFNKTFEPFTSLSMNANMIDDTVYHQTDTELVESDPYLRKIITGKNTTYSSLINPKYLYPNPVGSTNFSATTYTGLPANATYSSSKTNYVPDYKNSIELSRTR